jgi:hypothetical protein
VYAQYLTSTDIVRAVLTTVGPQPTCDSINIHSVGDQDAFFAHIADSTTVQEEGYDGDGLDDQVCAGLYTRACSTWLDIRSATLEKQSEL